MKMGKHSKRSKAVRYEKSTKKKIGYVVLFSTVLLSSGFLIGDQSIHASETDGKWEPRSIEQIKKDVAGKSEYTIVWGDTLSGISLATNLTMEKLASLNGIGDYNLIYAGNKMIFEGNTVTVQDANGTIKDRQTIQESDKVVPNQPVGDSVAQTQQTSPTEQTPTVDSSADASGEGSGQLVSPTTPESPTDPTPPSQPEQPTTPVQPEKPTQPETPTQPEVPTEPEQPVEPQVKYTVWFTAYEGDDASKNIVRGNQLFDSEAEATAFIENYADQLLMQGIAGSYGVMSWEV